MDSHAAPPASAERVVSRPPSVPAGQAGAATPEGSVAQSPVSNADTQVIYTAALHMAVYQVDDAQKRVETVAKELGGHLEQRQDRSITVRVPASRFGDAIARIEALGNVTHRDVRAQSVTEQVTDLEVRLRNARAMRDRLEQLLRGAQIKEALDIERELGRLTEQIERIEAQLKTMKDKVAFATIAAEFAPLSAPAPQPTAFSLPFPWLEDLGLSALLSLKDAR